MVQQIENTWFSTDSILSFGPKKISHTLCGLSFSHIHFLIVSFTYYLKISKLILFEIVGLDDSE